MNFCLEHLDIPWGLRFPETGIKGSCDLPDVNGRDWTRVSEKTECALKQWAFLFSPYLSFWFRTLDSFTFTSWRNGIFFKSFSSTVFFFFFSFNLSLCIRMSIVWMLSYLVNTAKSNLIQVPQDLYQRIQNLSYYSQVVDWFIFPSDISWAILPLNEFMLVFWPSTFTLCLCISLPQRLLSFRVDFRDVVFSLRQVLTVTPHYFDYESLH